MRYSNNETLEKEHKNTIPFKIAPKKNQIPGNTPDQGGKGPISKELWNINQGNYRRCKEMETFHAPGLEKLIL